MSSCTKKREGNERCIALNDGHKMPLIALGTLAPSMISEELLTKKGQTVSGELTSQTVSNAVKEATKTALDVGYHHVDCAYSYMAEEAVGQAFRDKIAEGAMKREDLFYTTKLWGTFHRPDLVRTAVEKALASVQLDYIDLFIIHHPVSLKPGEDLFPTDENGAALFDYVDLRKTWEAMEQCKDAGLVKSIGVSNFNRQQLEHILNKPGLKYKPVCNQVECHPYLNQNKLLEFCKANAIVIAAYGVLGSPTAGQWVDQSYPPILKDTTLISIGEKYKKTAAQVSIRYIIQRGCAAVVKSFNPERMKQNLQVFDFNLSKEDMEAIDNLNQNARYWKSQWWESHPEYPFKNGN